MIRQQKQLFQDMIESNFTRHEAYQFVRELRVKTKTNSKRAKAVKIWSYSNRKVRLNKENEAVEEWLP